MFFPFSLLKKLKKYCSLFDTTLSTEVKEKERTIENNFTEQLLRVERNRCANVGTKSSYILITKSTCKIKTE